jgi:hypothetical protein
LNLYEIHLPSAFLYLPLTLPSTPQQSLHLEGKELPDLLPLGRCGIRDGSHLKAAVKVAPTSQGEVPSPGDSSGSLSPREQLSTPAQMGLEEDYSFAIDPYSSWIQHAENLRREEADVLPASHPTQGEGAKLRGGPSNNASIRKLSPSKLPQVGQSNRMTASPLPSRSKSSRTPGEIQRSRSVSEHRQDDVDQEKEIRQRKMRSVMSLGKANNSHNRNHNNNNNNNNNNPHLNHNSQIEVAILSQGGGKNEVPYRLTESRDGIMKTLAKHATTRRKSHLELLGIKESDVRGNHVADERKRKSVTAQRRKMMQKELENLFSEIHAIRSEMGDVNSSLHSLQGLNRQDACVQNDPDELLSDDAQTMRDILVDRDAEIRALKRHQVVLESEIHSLRSFIANLPDPLIPVPAKSTSELEAPEPGSMFCSAVPWINDDEGLSFRIHRSQEEKDNVPTPTVAQLGWNEERHAAEIEELNGEISELQKKLNNALYTIAHPEPIPSADAACMWSSSDISTLPLHPLQAQFACLEDINFYNESAVEVNRKLNILNYVSFHELCTDILIYLSQHRGFLPSTSMALSHCIRKYIRAYVGEDVTIRDFQAFLDELSLVSDDSSYLTRLVAQGIGVHAIAPGQDALNVWHGARVLGDWLKRGGLTAPLLHPESHGSQAQRWWLIEGPVLEYLRDVWKIEALRLDQIKEKLSALPSYSIHSDKSQILLMEAMSVLQPVLMEVQEHMRLYLWEAVDAVWKKEKEKDMEKDQEKELSQDDSSLASGVESTSMLQPMSLCVETVWGEGCTSWQYYSTLAQLMESSTDHRGIITHGASEQCLWDIVSLNQLSLPTTTDDALLQEIETLQSQCSRLRGRKFSDVQRAQARWEQAKQGMSVGSPFTAALFRNTLQKLRDEQVAPDSHRSNKSSHSNRSNKSSHSNRSRKDSET